MCPNCKQQAKRSSVKDLKNKQKMPAQVIIAVRVTGLTFLVKDSSSEVRKRENQLYLMAEKGE